MGRRMKRTIPEIVQAIKDNRGLMYNAANSLQIHPSTLHDYVNRYPSVREAVDEPRGLVLDLCESKLYEAIERGEPWAITFTLRTLGKHRGYYDTREQSPGSVGVEMIGNDPYARLDAKIRGILASVEKDEIIN